MNYSDGVWLTELRVFTLKLRSSDQTPAERFFNAVDFFLSCEAYRKGGIFLN